MLADESARILQHEAVSCRARRESSEIRSRVSARERIWAAVSEKDRLDTLRKRRDAEALTGTAPKQLSPVKD
jgi:hypothetical protein